MKPNSMTKALDTVAGKKTLELTPIPKKSLILIKKKPVETIKRTGVFV